MWSAGHENARATTGSLTHNRSSNIAARATWSSAAGRAASRRWRVRGRRSPAASCTSTSATRAACWVGAPCPAACISWCCLHVCEVCVQKTTCKRCESPLSGATSATRAACWVRGLLLVSVARNPASHCCGGALSVPSNAVRPANETLPQTSSQVLLRSLRTSR